MALSFVSYDFFNCVCSLLCFVLVGVLSCLFVFGLPLLFFVVVCCCISLCFSGLLRVVARCLVLRCVCVDGLLFVVCFVVGCVRKTHIVFSIYLVFPFLLWRFICVLFLFLIDLCVFVCLCACLWFVVVCCGLFLVCVFGVLFVLFVVSFPFLLLLCCDLFLLPVLYLCCFLCVLSCCSSVCSCFRLCDCLFLFVFVVVV